MPRVVLTASDEPIASLQGRTFREEPVEDPHIRANQKYFRNVVSSSQGSNGDQRTLYVATTASGSGEKKFLGGKSDREACQPKGASPHNHHLHTFFKSHTTTISTNTSKCIFSTSFVSLIRFIYSPAAHLCSNSAHP
jgi:hypothetical protein